MIFEKIVLAYILIVILSIVIGNLVENALYRRKRK